MKKILFVFMTLSTVQHVSSQDITTTVITLDLAKPTKNSVKHSGKKKSLVVDSKNPLAFKLINGNPYRFRYVLNYKKVNLFTSETFDPRPEEDGNSIVDSLNKTFTQEVTTNQNDIEGLQEKSNSIKGDIASLKASIKAYIDNIATEETLDFKVFNSKKQEYKKQYLGLLKATNTLQKEIDAIEATDGISSAQKEIVTALEATKVLIEKLFNTKQNIYLLPLDINGDNIDYVEVQLDIYDGENETPETYTYKVWIKGGLKIDVSGGVLISSLFDKEYYTTDSENNEKFIYENDLGSYDFGFGTMVNIIPRSAHWVRPTLNFGAMFTPNQNFQMLAGGGLIFGKNERFVIHSGISMGSVSVLKKEYQVGKETSYDFGAEGNIPVSQQFKFGHFFGITYDLSKVSSNKDVND